MSNLESLSGSIDLSFDEYFHPPEEPFELVQKWFSDAVSADCVEPYNVCLATADKFGCPSNRMIAVSAVESDRIIFATHSTSLKAKQIDMTGWASTLSYWKEIKRQLILTGPVNMLSDEESDLLWNNRPEALYPVTCASYQSEPIDQLDSLVHRVEKFSLRQQKEPLPRPDRFIGFQLQFQKVEFWSASSNRLHKRLEYTCLNDVWANRYLQP